MFKLFNLKVKQDSSLQLYLGNTADVIFNKLVHNSNNNKFQSLFFLMKFLKINNVKLPYLQPPPNTRTAHINLDVIPTRKCYILKK